MSIRDALQGIGVNAGYAAPTMSYENLLNSQLLDQRYSLAQQNAMQQQMQKQAQQRAQFQGMADLLPEGTMRTMAQAGYDPSIAMDLQNLTLKKQQQNRLQNEQQMRADLQRKLFGGGEARAQATQPMGLPQQQPMPSISKGSNEQMPIAQPNNQPSAENPIERRLSSIMEREDQVYQKYRPNIERLQAALALDPSMQDAIESKIESVRNQRDRELGRLDFARDRISKEMDINLNRKFETEKKLPKARLAYSSLSNKLDVADRAIEIIKENSSGLTTGFVGAAGSLVPGTNAYKVSKAIETVRSIGGFGELQTLKASSPTGGGVGNLTEKEFDRLAAQGGNLAQGLQKEDLLEQVELYENYLNRSKKDLANAFLQDFGEFLSPEEKTSFQDLDNMQTENPDKENVVINFDELPE